MHNPTMTPTNDRASGFLAVPGIWKLLCALAILVGHHLVTAKAMRPDSALLSASFDLLQFFSPLHFFMFSGYLAAGSLANRNRRMWGIVGVRAIRIYVLIASALALGLAVRLAFDAIPGSAPGTPWPLEAWAMPLDFRDVLRHLSPFGFVDTTRFNYASWYLYQELRLVLFFPFFRWVLCLRSPDAKWLCVAAVLAVATVFEHVFWSAFPLFRTSPFETMGFGACFLSGALLRQELGQGGRLAAIPPPAAWGALAMGLAIASLAPLSIELPVDNPCVFTATILLAQILVFCALDSMTKNVSTPPLLRTACSWSVGIYIVHPPLHVVATWAASASDSLLPLWTSVVVAVPLGGLYHKWIESPSGKLGDLLFPPGRR